MSLCSILNTYASVHVICIYIYIYICQGADIAEYAESLINLRVMACLCIVVIPVAFLCVIDQII
jgi:hypothetical protein